MVGTGRVGGNFKDLAHMAGEQQGAIREQEAGVIEAEGGQGGDRSTIPRVGGEQRGDGPQVTLNEVTFGELFGGRPMEGTQWFSIRNL